VADRRLGVLGGPPGSVRYAQIVRQWSDDLVYFAAPGTLTVTHRSELVSQDIDIVEGPVEGLVVDDDRLIGVRLVGGRVVPRDALFVPPRFVPNNALLVGVGCAVDDGGWPVTDGAGRTSVHGVWAAWNVVDPRAQVITVAGAGSAAAISINAELVEDDVRRAVHAFSHGHPTH
jgi:thioredoxin reductase